MKQFWEIRGPRTAPREYCLAFEKLDGSCMRFGWSKKQGWHKFGTRRQMIDANTPIYGKAIPMFMTTLAEGIEKAIREEREYRNVDEVIAYCEFFGPKSFAGWHVEGDAMDVVLFDVNIGKHGLVPPRDFIKRFGHLHRAQTVYEGNFNASFIEDVYNGKYGTGEGVVAKGLLPGGGRHSLWMAKAKSKAWLDELRRRATEAPEVFGKVLSDNEKEQSLGQI